MKGKQDRLANRDPWPPREEVTVDILTRDNLKVLTAFLSLG
ncbi:MULTISPECIES: hypothetical protein [Kitasatospora]